MGLFNVYYSPAISDEAYQWIVENVPPSMVSMDESTYQYQMDSIMKTVIDDSRDLMIDADSFAELERVSKVAQFIEI